MPLGNVYDGVLLLSNFGQAIRTDPVAPISKVLFEWDIQTGEASVRQADTPTFHRWEVAGTAHVDHHLRLSDPDELDRLSPDALWARVWSLVCRGRIPTSPAQRWRMRQNALSVCFEIREQWRQAATILQKA